jgi:hypothetical protein
MTYSIDQFKGLINSKGGVAQANVFRVQLPSLPGASTTEVDLLCTRVNIPGKQISTLDKEIGLKTERIAYKTIYEEVSMTFMLMNDYGIRKYFETWTSMAINPNTYQMGYKKDYCHQIKIEQLRKGFGLPVYSTPLGIPKLPTELQNRLPRIGPFDFAQGQLDLNAISGDKVVYSVMLEDAFPTTVTGVELGNANGDAIMEFQVTLAYTKYTTNAVTANPKKDLVQSVLGTIASKIF